MNGNPLDVALRNVVETKSLLETLITSSESFDYPKAKLALKQLQRKARELAKLQVAMEKARQVSAQPNVRMIDFRNQASKQPAQL